MVAKPLLLSPDSWTRRWSEVKFPSTEVGSVKLTEI